MSRREVIVERLRSIGPRERSLLIILGIIVLLILLWLLLSLGGGDEEAPETVRSPRARATPTVTATATPTSPPETDEAFEGKDPFQPLVVPPAPAAGGAEPTPTGSVGAPTGGDQTSSAPTVALIDVFTDEQGERTATVEVDGKDYNVHEGETFADNFRVLDLTSRCGTFVFGDERFTLCVGQEVRK